MPLFMYFDSHKIHSCTDALLVPADQKNTPAPTVVYSPCNADSHCDRNQFCAVECFTGGCGRGRDVPAGTLGKFCQPCDRCQSPFDSWVRNCKVCSVLAAGNKGTFQYTPLLSNAIILQYIFKCCCSAIYIQLAKDTMLPRLALCSLSLSLTTDLRGHNSTGQCLSDSDCAEGSYCTSKETCGKFDPEYCNTVSCGLGDAGSFVCWQSP